MKRKLLASTPAAPERPPRAGKVENVAVFRFFCWECFRTVVSADDFSQFPPVCRRCGKRMELVAACVMGRIEAAELERAEREYEAERRRRAKRARRSTAGRACGRAQQGALLFGHF